VLLFFLVSGFIMSHVIRSENRTEFVIKRIFRIAPMLIFGLILTYTISAALVSFQLPPSLGFGARSIADLVRSIFLLDMFIPSPTTLTVTWSLVPEVGFYAIIAATWPLLLRRPMGGSYLMIAIVAAIEIAWMVLGPFRSGVYFFMQIEFIVVGRAIYLAHAGLASRRASIMLAATALLTLTLLHLYWAYPRSQLLGSDSVVISWVIAIAAFLGLLRVRHCPRPLRFLSNASYSIYLLHISIGSLLLNVLCLRFGLPIAPAFMITVAGILLVSSLTFRFVEVPGQRFGRYLIGATGSKRTLDAHA
jgi:peptidoglycan/LPS O-acetylase OafA/YrhL